jgi:hypothetical protein
MFLRAGEKDICVERTAGMSWRNVGEIKFDCKGTGNADRLTRARNMRFFQCF